MQFRSLLIFMALLWIIGFSIEEGRALSPFQVTDMPQEMHPSLVSDPSAIYSDTKTHLISSPNPSQFCHPLTLTATVTPSFATGSVKFFNATTEIGIAPLNNLATATLTVSNLEVGAHSITAVYQGDSILQPSVSHPVTHIVNRSTTTTNLTHSVNPSNTCQEVTFVATVQANPPCASVPTGKVTFLNGVLLLGTATLNQEGVAIFIASALSMGSHQITAEYGGDENFLHSNTFILQTVHTPPVEPPQHMRGYQIKSEFATQTDIINVLSWKAPTHNCIVPIAYQIFRDQELKHFVAEISAHDKLKFKDHNRKEGRTYHYFVVSIDEFDRISVPAEITIKPKK